MFSFHPQLNVDSFKTLEKEFSECLQIWTEDTGKDAAQDLWMKSNFSFHFNQPQNSIPDVVIWMFKNGRRAAYVRIPTYKILWSEQKQMRGKNCGALRTFWMQVRTSIYFKINY